MHFSNLTSAQDFDYETKPGPGLSLPDFSPFFYDLHLQARLFFFFLQASPGLYSATGRLAQQRAENRKQLVLLVPSFSVHTEVP